MPYAPGTAYRGDQYLFEGIAHAGHDIGRALETFIDRRNAEKNAAKSAEYWAKALGDKLPEATGMTPEQFEGLSYKDKASAMGAAFQADTMKRLKLEQAMQQQRLQMAMESQKQLAAQNVDAEQFFKDFNGAPTQTQTNGQVQLPDGSGFQPAISQVAPSLQDRVLYALGRNPKAGLNPQIGNTLSAIERLANMGGKAAPAVQEGKTETGTPYVTYGNTFQFDPRATGEQRLTNEKALLDAREAARANRAQELTPEQLLKSYDEDLKWLSSTDALMSTSKEQRAALRAEIQSARDTLRSGKGGTEPASMELPKDKSKLKKGQRYTTARGVAVWDGNKFVKD